MNNLRLLFCLLIINGFALSQSNNEIKEWQEKNPDILLIEKNDATDELIEQFNSLGIKYIIFENEIKESDILTFTSNISLKVSYYQLDGYNVKMEEAQFVKEWFAGHPDIKVISNSVASQLTSDQFNFYKSIDALILEGEIITMKDLKNYDNEH